MKPFESQTNVTFLKPGELFFTREPSLVLTVLGSCVSITMFNKRLGLGAISHAQLPTSKPRGRCDRNCPVTCTNSSQQNEAFKYVDCSLYYMLHLFNERGIKQNEIEVKMFGGADVLPPRNEACKSMTIGKQNIETALKILKSEKIPVTASNIGGVRGRKIFFYTHTGDVLLKHVKGVSK